MFIAAWLVALAGCGPPTGPALAPEGWDPTFGCVIQARTERDLHAVVEARRAAGAELTSEERRQLGLDFGLADRSAGSIDEARELLWSAFTEGCEDGCLSGVMRQFEVGVRSGLGDVEAGARALTCVSGQPDERKQLATARNRR